MQSNAVQQRTGEGLLDNLRDLALLWREQTSSLAHKLDGLPSGAKERKMKLTYLFA